MGIQRVRDDDVSVANMVSRQEQIASYYLAKTMMKTFGYHKWMSRPHVVGPGGERIIERVNHGPDDELYKGCWWKRKKDGNRVILVREPDLY